LRRKQLRQSAEELAENARDLWRQTDYDTIMNQAERKAIGSRLAKLRAQAGMTLDQLANEADMHRMSVAHLEWGERLPRLDTVVKLARALGMAPDQLVAILVPSRQNKGG
jgi:DNA-binding XRE family transcriptional regulator